jgi:hypothetical protein
LPLDILQILDFVCITIKFTDLKGI